MATIKDQHRYDNNRKSVRLHRNTGSVSIDTKGPEIPLAANIRQILAAGLTVVHGLSAGHNPGGTVSGTTKSGNITFPDPGGVGMHWWGDGILLISNAGPPTQAEGFVAQMVAGVLEQALFKIARDGDGYPLILSSHDRTLVDWVMIRAWERQAGKDETNRILALLSIPAFTGTG